MSSQKDPDKLQNFTEWQDHQYDPGYWTGGRLPPLARQGKGSKRYGYLYIAVGLFMLVGVLLIELSLIMQRPTAEEFVDGLPTLFCLLAVPGLLLIIGYRFVKIGQKVERQEHGSWAGQRRKRRRKR